VAACTGSAPGPRGGREKREEKQENFWDGKGMEKEGHIGERGVRRKPPGVDVDNQREGGQAEWGSFGWKE